MMASLCMAQMPPHSPVLGADPHAGTTRSLGAVPSSRTEFGRECGIHDTSVQSAMGLSRAVDGTWSANTVERPGMPSENAAARVWRESNWMVDLHEAPGQGVTTLHTGQMCFDAKGRITRMIDRYLDRPKCDCLRFTTLNFDEASGRVMRREQRFVSVTTGAEIAAPEAAKGFPEIWGFRRLEQLPFYSLVKK
jgi:hypothetical protein